MGKNTLGKTIRTQRETLGWTLAELASKVSVSTTTLSRLETGDSDRRPSEKLLERLSVVLDLDQDALFLAAGRLPKDVLRWMTRSPEALQRVRALMAA